MRGAFALPAVATLIAGICALRASHFVTDDIAARQRRALAPVERAPEPIRAGSREERKLVAE
jgi:hypothetical protein